MNIGDYLIPETAGCYLFKNDKDQIIYVGKSKFLPKRVKSYFQKKHEDKKTQKLVTEAHSVDFITTESENEALVLEEDLIKLYKPKFNIKGKDDRTIRSLLVITDEPWSKVELYFPHEKASGQIICQFTSGKVAKEVVSLIHDIFPLRTCSYNLTDENIEKGKFKPCLEWHLGRCPAPCRGVAKKFQHLEVIKLIREMFLTYSTKSTNRWLWKKMKFHSDNLEFEKANDYKIKINLLKRLQRALNPIKLRSARLRCTEIGQKLGLRFSPTIIDAFDNSHTAGEEAVCGLVRFNLLQPEKSGWRKFIIKSGVGGDDIHSFEEVLTRRFLRFQEVGQQNLPNLIIIDGGRTQFAIAEKIITKFQLNGKFDLISISKNSKHKPETIHLSGGREVPVREFFELTKIIEEVHRFAKNFHSVRRSKKSLGVQKKNPKS